MSTLIYLYNIYRYDSIKLYILNNEIAQNLKYQRCTVQTYMYGIRFVILLVITDMCRLNNISYVISFLSRNT
jgi:GTP cyclohydrolase III